VITDPCNLNGKTESLSRKGNIFDCEGRYRQPSKLMQRLIEREHREEWDSAEARAKCRERYFPYLSQPVG